MNTFRKDVSKGMTWKLVEQFLRYGLQFVIGVILARLLSPTEFGLVGIVGIFLGVLPIFIDGGFGSALLQKKNPTETDYSTVFYVNVGMGAFLSFLMYVSSASIAAYFKNDDLTNISRVLSFSLFIVSIGSVHNIILSNKLNFKGIAQVFISSQVISGVLSILAAGLGAGIWALVIKIISQNLLSTTFLLFKTKWMPLRIFDFDALKKLFSFGSYLFLGNVLQVLVKNVNLFVVGKYHTPLELGYYTRAEQFSKVPFQNLTMAVQKVLFPAFSQIQDNTVKLMRVNQTMMSVLMYMSATTMMVLFLCAEPVVILLVGEVWRPVIPYLQLLCLSIVWYPAHSINVNILNVLGKSKLTLIISGIKNLLMIPVLVMGVLISVKAMLIGMIVHSVIGYMINTYYTGSIMGYSLKLQQKQIMPSLTMSILIGVGLYFVQFAFIVSNEWLKLLLNGGSAILLVILVSELFKITGYQELKNQIKKRVS